MAKTKKVEVKEEVVVQGEKTEVKATILPLTQEFGNGELNVLRDKINELIANR